MRGMEPKLSPEQWHLRRTIGPRGLFIAFLLVLVTLYTGDRRVYGGSD